MIDLTRPLLLAAAAIAVCGAGRSTTLRQPIVWTVDAEEKALAAGKVQLSLTVQTDENHRSQHSNTTALTALDGLRAGAFAPGPSRNVSFRLVRPAGLLDCAGVARVRAGSGECRFVANAHFVRELERRGMGRPDELQLYHLTTSGADLAVLDELERHDYPKANVDDLVKLGIFKVTPTYVRELAVSGYRLRWLDDLVQFKIFDITPAYIAELAAIGPKFRAIPAARLVKYRIFKVAPATVRELAALGYDDLDGELITRFAIFKVTPQFIRELRALGYRDVPADKLIELRVHGVTPEYIRGLGRAGIALPGINQLARMRMSGFDPALRGASR
jgi:hypothetical protein